MLAALNLRVLVPESYIIKMDSREINCGDGRWIKLAQGRIQWLAVIFTVLKFKTSLTGVI